MEFDLSFSADHLFETISRLVMCHSPSGAEAEVDAVLAEHFANAGLPVTVDPCGNMIATIKGRGDGVLAITAHKDEIGAVVTDLEEDGRINVRNLGGAFPWIYGEGPVDILGDNRIVTGILSFGSRHVAHGAPQLAFAETAPLKWADVWVECHQSAENLAAAGVRPGSKIVIGKHRKNPMRLGNHIASYALDNKASLAVLIELANKLKDPPCDVMLVATSKEEVGAVGGLYFTQNTAVDALIALEIMPVAKQYAIKFGPQPVVLAEDGVFFYDDILLAGIQSAAQRRSIGLQIASVTGFGSDASIALKQGHIARGACLGFPAQNTHGFEIANLDSIIGCGEILKEFCSSFRRN